MTAFKLNRARQEISMMESVPVRAQVNLLPTEIVAARGIRGLQRKLALGVLGFVALVIIAVVFASLRVDNAQTDLANEQQRTTDLLLEQRKYITVTEVKTRLVASQGALLSASSTEILWADYLALIAGATPDGVVLTSMTSETSTPLAGPAAIADPLQREGVGVITLGARSLTRPDVTAWTRALNQVPGLGDARILVSTVSGNEGEDVFEASVTVRVLTTALSTAAGTEGTG